jgi:hypothetical protein
MGTMTKSEREDLQRLVRQREKAQKSWRGGSVRPRKS